MPFKSRAQEGQKAGQKVRSVALIALVLMLASCGGSDEAQQQTDTVMVFSAAPSAKRADSTTRAQSTDEIMAALNAYSDHKISADSAAKVIVVYQKKSGRSLNIVMDPELIAAVRREQERKK